jgi:threonine dehydrogenase-like Zn-dependent dehydrogenase
MCQGCACVFEVTEIGSDVNDVAIGDRVLTVGAHQSYQRIPAECVTRVPDALTAETATFARVAKISMPTFVLTSVRPPEIVIVAGLGAVGLMTAQVARLYGYSLIACEPNRQRRHIASRLGVRHVRDCIPEGDPDVRGYAALGIDCSGNAEAVRCLCDVVRARGDVFLIGMPVMSQSDILAEEVLCSVFHGFINLRSGSEWTVPDPPHPHNHQQHTAQAMQWLAEGALKVDPALYRKVAPTDPHPHYQDILSDRLEALTVMFDWRA